MADFSYQLYSSRNFGPLPQTLKMLGDLGYKYVEGYGGLFADLSELDKLKGDLASNGLVMKSGHFGMDMVRDNPARVIEIAKAVGMEQVYVPAIAKEERTKDADGWRKLGATLETIGKPIADAGLVFGWHNHDFEFVPCTGGEMPQDLMFEAGPSLAWEIDVAWVVRGKRDPETWMARYRDRIRAAHVKDIAPAGECADEDGWADVGQGSLPWARYMAALRGTPASLFVMEHDNPKDDARFARRSIAAARAL